MAAKVTTPISPLRRALAESRLREVDVAEALGVDPKTVQRWVAGRVPQRRHRPKVARALDTPEEMVRDGLKFHWSLRAACVPTSWQVNFLVRHEGRVIGSQSLHGKYSDLPDDLVHSAEVDLMYSLPERRRMRRSG